MLQDPTQRNGAQGRDLPAKKWPQRIQLLKPMVQLFACPALRAVIVRREGAVRAPEAAQEAVCQDAARDECRAVRPRLLLNRLVIPRPKHVEGELDHRRTLSHRCSRYGSRPSAHSPASEVTGLHVMVQPLSRFAI